MSLDFLDGCLNDEFVVFITLLIEVRALLEVDAIVFALDSDASSLSLLWLLAAMEKAIVLKFHGEKKLISISNKKKDKKNVVQ